MGSFHLKRPSSHQRICTFLQIMSPPDLSNIAMSKTLKMQYQQRLPAMAGTGYHSNIVENRASFGRIDLRDNLTEKGLAVIYRQEIIQDVTLFTSQSAAAFYNKLFTYLDFTPPRAAIWRRSFPKEAMVCAFIIMKHESFSQITDIADHLVNNQLIAHYCGFRRYEISAIELAS